MKANILASWARPKALGMVLTLVAVLPCTSSAAEVLDHWHWRNPGPFANTINSVAYGAGKFVAVGEGGVIHTSFDGATWDDGRRPVTSVWRKVFFVNGQFVAVGHDGLIGTSSDGYSWTLRNSDTTNHLFAVTFGGGHYVACGDLGRITSSTDGVNWTRGNVGTNALRWITYGNGVFIVPTPNQQMAVNVSSDLQTWTTATVSNISGFYPHYLLGAQFGNGAGEKGLKVSS